MRTSRLERSARRSRRGFVGSSAGGGGGAPVPTTPPVYEGRSGFISTTGSMAGITGGLGLTNTEGDYAIVSCLFEATDTVSVSPDDSFELIASTTAAGTAFYVFKLEYNGTDTTVSLNATSPGTITAGFMDAVRYTNGGVPQIVAPYEVLEIGDATQVGTNFTYTANGISHSIDQPSYSGTNWAVHWCAAVGDDGNWTQPAGWVRSQSSSTSGSDASVAQFIDEPASDSLDGTTRTCTNTDINLNASATILLAIPGLADLS